jgi:hypothetical protein
MSRSDAAGLTELIGKLRDDLGRLFRLEIRLARAELEERLVQAGKAGAMMVAAAVLGLGFLVCLLAAVVMGMQAVFVAAGMSPRGSLALGLVAVALFTGALSAGLAVYGKRVLTGRLLKPTDTMESLRSSSDLLRGDRDDEQ